MPRLRRADCSAPGIRRRRAGRGFTYLGPDGRRVTDPATLARIRALAVPPAWTDVWICADPMGHIQALGIDARGRRQYLYHQRWRERRDREKFDHMVEFGRALPSLRAVVSHRLGQEGLTRERVLACAVRLLDLGFFRIGSEGYAEENQTYGLATIRRSHVKVEGDVLVFDYPAKGGKRQLRSMAGTDVVAVVRELKARRGGGPELLAWRDGRRWADVRSADINAWIREVTGAEFSAKDFRTWNATVLAAAALAVSWPAARSDTARKRAVSRAMAEVATYLGNTAAVCRSSYVDPRVVDRYRTGATVLDALADLEADAGGLHTHGAVEEAVLDLLDETA